MKHKAVYRSLIQRIRSGEYGPGSQIPTEVNLGREFNVSRPTIARAMRDLQQEGLVERRAGYGTYVVDQGRNAAELSVGLLIPELGYGDIFDPICARLTRAAQQAQIGVIWSDISQSDAGANRGRLDVSSEEALSAAELLVAREVNGVFFAPLTSGRDDQKINQRILSRLRDNGIHVVLLDRDVTPFPERSEYDLVSVDHYAGQFIAARQLIRTGHKRIAYLRWPGPSDSIMKRISALHACIRLHATEKVTAFEVEGDPLDEGLVRGIVDDGVDAIPCENDFIATQLLQTLARLGIDTPGDVSVVGFNDLQISKFLGTPLTTVAQPYEQIGEVAVEVIRQRIDHPSTPARAVLLKPTFMARESSRPTD